MPKVDIIHYKIKNLTIIYLFTLTIEIKISITSFINIFKNLKINELDLKNEYS